MSDAGIVVTVFYLAADADCAEWEYTEVAVEFFWCFVCCIGCASNVLQVCGLPSGLPCSQLDSYLSDLVMCFSARRFDVVRDSWHVPSSLHAADTVDGCCVLAVFDSEDAALTALTYHSSAKYKLQPYAGWILQLHIHFVTVFCTGASVLGEAWSPSNCLRGVQPLMRVAASNLVAKTFKQQKNQQVCSEDDSPFCYFIYSFSYLTTKGK